MSNDTPAKKPARIHSVLKRPGRKPQWAIIGAAWPHKNGPGFNLEFYAKPFDNAELVILFDEKEPDDLPVSE